MTKILALLARMMAFSLALTSCTGGNSRLVPQRPQDEPFKSVLRQELSTFNIAIDLSDAELSDTLNRMVPRELYNGATKTSGVAAKVVRHGSIAVRAAEDYLHCTVPVSLSLRYGSFESAPLTTVLSFKLRPRVEADWGIKTDVTFTGIGSRVADEVKIGPFALKPRSMIESALLPLQGVLSGLVDRKLNESFSLKGQATKTWSAVQKPILLDKKYNAWLVATPTELLLFPLTARGSRVKVSAGIRTVAEVVVGPEPAPPAPRPLPPLRKVSAPDRTFRVALNTDLYYRDIRAIVLPLLLGRDFGRAGSRVTLKDLEFYGSGERLVVKVETEGAVNGIFYLTCRPVFNAATGRFSVQDVDFDLDSRNLLLTTADWFLHGPIRESIQEKLNLDLTQRLQQARDLAAKSLSRVQLSDNLVLSATLTEVKLGDVLVQKEKISIRVNAEGETAIAFR